MMSEPIISVSGLRGVVGQSLTPEIALRYACAFAAQAAPGPIVLTQDGRIAKQLIGDESEIDKEYLVRVRTRDGRPLPKASLELLRHGLSLDEQPLRPAEVEWANDDQLRFVLREGKKRQIRRMCELVGLKVVGLKRIRIGRVTLGNLPVGQWRYLSPHERF